MPVVCMCQADQQDPASRRARRRVPLRLRGAIAAVPCWTLIAFAASLPPQKAGYGTHEQLNQPPCSFLVRYHIPCPTCGMTTSMAAMARARAAEAFAAQPAGVILFLAVAAFAVFGTAETITGRDMLRYLAVRRWRWWLIAAIVVPLAGWGVKLALGFSRGLLPIS